MNLFDYIVNLSIFSLLVSTPLVIRSFLNHKPLKQFRFWVGLYGGLVSCLLIMLSMKEEGYSLDIRYAVLILVFAYLGPVEGLITGLLALLSRVLISGAMFQAVFSWVLIMLVFTVLNPFISRLSPIKRCVVLFGVLVVVYVLTIFTFQIFIDQPLMHVQYLGFALLGVIIGGLLIESYEKLYRIITEKKSIEQTLEASESKYRLIAENTYDLIMVIDHTRSISYSSPSHERVLGYPGSELERGKLCTLIHPEDVDMFRVTVQRMFEWKDFHAIEVRFRHKEGHWIEFESRCMPVKKDNEKESIGHIVMISRDITERKKAEELLLQSEKLAVVGELAAGVAHEIRNPLTTIKGFLQLNQKENGWGAYNDLLLSELERIEAFTSELLSLGKPQAIQLNRANLRELIKDTLELLTPQALLCNIEFKWSEEASNYLITCEKIN